MKELKVKMLVKTVDYQQSVHTFKSEPQPYVEPFVERTDKTADAGQPDSLNQKNSM